jgi:hypothetical protein
MGVQSVATCRRGASAGVFVVAIRRRSPWRVTSSSANLPSQSLGRHVVCGNPPPQSPASHVEQCNLPSQSLGRHVVCGNPPPQSPASRVEQRNLPSQSLGRHVVCGNPPSQSPASRVEQRNPSR